PVATCVRILLRAAAACADALGRAQAAALGACFSLVARVHFVLAIAFDGRLALLAIAPRLRRRRGIDRRRIDGLDGGVVLDGLADERILVANVGVDGVAGRERRACRANDP